MSAANGLIEGILILGATILLALLLRKTGVLKEEHSGLFSKLVLKITLPALVFSSLVVNPFNRDYMIMAGIMFVVEVIILVIAWIIARALKFGKAETGALILVSAFGMTTFLGYPVIREVFPGNSQALQEAVITSEIGVGFLLFIMGPLIAMYFGESIVSRKELLKSVRNFFVSPLFIALIAGIIFSVLNVNSESRVFEIILKILKKISNANFLLVGLTLGLIIEFKAHHRILMFVSIAILLKVFFKPLLAYWFTEGEQFTEMMRQIVFIETAMPSAILTAVFAKHYNCKPKLVSTTIVISLIVCLVSLGVLFGVLF